MRRPAAVDPSDVRAGVRGERSASWLAALVASFIWTTCSPPPDPDPEVTTVAVLPLRNMNADPEETDYLAHGITRSVITRLTQAGLRTTPWETARRYVESDAPVEEIGRELQADAVLVGTFELISERILCTLSLVEPASGYQYWAEEFDEPFQDLLRVQRRIAEGAATSLKRELSGEEEAALARPESGSADAYDYYLQGAHVMQDDTEEAALVAHGYFTQALEVDDGLVEAHIGLGAVETARYWSGWAGLESLRLAEASFQKALELSPASAGARRGLLRVYNEQGSSEAVLEQGELARRSGGAQDVETLLARAEAYVLGALPDRAVPILQEVVSIDPVNHAAHWHLVHNFFNAGRFEQAIYAGETYLRRFGEDPHVHVHMATSYHALGRTGAALEHYDKTSRTAQESFAAYTDLLALMYGGMLLQQTGDSERAAERWRRGVSLATPRLEASPDQTRLRLFLAAFHSLLGDGEASLVDEREALRLTALNPWELYMLAAAVASTGQTERAAGLLLRSLWQGRAHGGWRVWFELGAEVPSSSETFDRFLREHEVRLNELKEAY